MKRVDTPYLLTHGFELSLAVALTVISLVFTISPEALEHAPVGFEIRGPIHHGFHFTLLGGSVAMLFGLVLARARLEMVGLILVTGAISMNLIALLTDPQSATEGLPVALRVAVLTGVVGRLYLIAFYLPRLAARIRNL